VAVPRNYTVEFARVAEGDVLAIVDYLAVHDPGAALRALHQFEAAAASLEKFPNRGRIVPELEVHGLVTHRELVIAPWRMVYRMAGQAVYVVAVFDGRRNLEDVLLDRAVRATDAG